MWAEGKSVESSSRPSSVCLLDSEDLPGVIEEGGPTREKEPGSLMKAPES